MVASLSRCRGTWHVCVALFHLEPLSRVPASVPDGHTTPPRRQFRSQVLSQTEPNLQVVGVILSNINYLPVASFATTKITVCLGHLLGIIVSSSSTFRYLKLLVRRLSVCTRWNLIYQRCSVESSCKQTKRMLTFSIYLPKCIMYILLGPTNIFSYQKNFKICCQVSFSPAYLHVCKCILLLHVQAPNKKETLFHCFAQGLVGTCALAKQVFACISW